MYLQRPKSWSRLSGFSIVEVVFVIAILGILGAMAIPRYGGFVARQQTAAAARRLVADLALAQRHARVTSSSQRIAFSVGSGQYQLLDMMDPDHPTRTYVVDLSQEPYRATIRTAEFGGDAEIAFDGFGAADTPGTIIVGVGRYRQVITVDGGATRPRMTNQVTVETVE